MTRLAGALSIAVILGLFSVTPALAGEPVPIRVPEPTTLGLLSGGLALAVIGARWFRRK